MEKRLFLRQIGLRPVGGNYKTIRRSISEYGLDTSHFTGQGWNVGLQFNPKPIVTNDTVFVKDSNFKCSWRLRERYKKVTGIENLQLLCPNCHALTDNYRGRAHLSALSEKRDVECRKFKETRPSEDGRQS